MSLREVIGHTAPIRILQHALERRHFGVSFLFYGPRGVGKAFAAKQFAKGLNCEKQSNDCCDSCSSCRTSDKGEYPDLHWFDVEGGSENIKIEQVRRMQEVMSLRPFEGKVKVCIIDNCQRLTEEAANSLLKILEEPSADSVIILMSTGLRLVLPTIASRCQKIRFSNLNRQQAECILEEKYHVNLEQRRYLAYYSDGKIGEALTLSQNEFFTQRDAVFSMLIQSTERKTSWEDIFKDKPHAQQALSILMSWFRDIVFVRLRMPKEYLMNQDKQRQITQQAAQYSPTQLFSMLDTLAKGFDYLKSNVNLKLLADTISVSLVWKN